MADSKDGAGSQSASKTKGKRQSADTQERLAEALRANLHRRKSQERSRNSAVTPKKPQNP